MTPESRRSPVGNRRLTIRARLTLTYAVLITGSGAVLITLVYLYMRFVPNYAILDHDVVGPSTDPSGPAGSAGATDGIAITSANDFLSNLLLASGVTLALLALAGGLVGWIVAGRVVRPLSRINAAAQLAASGSLGHQIELGGPQDEIRELADTFDDMLESLESSFAAQRRFTANASHELRSPLATTKTMIDVTLADPDADATELRELATRVGEVNQSSIETVEALLDLASAENGPSAIGSIDLFALTLDVVADHSEEAHRAQVGVEVPEGRGIAFGSAVLVRQALSNLVRNAIRHNHPGGQVTVTVTSGVEHVGVTVSNTGPVVEPAELDLLLEPFTRGSGRSLTRGRGHGLGLAIVDAAIKANRGTLELTANRSGGLSVTVGLPAARL